MTAGALVALLVVVGTAATGITYLLSRLFRTVPWLPLPNPPFGFEAVRYFGPVDPEHLTRALLTVARLLANNVPGWRYEAVSAALSGVHVFVYPTATFRGSGTVEVDGEQDGHHLYVGRGLAALCHEAAHRCGEVLDGNPYHGHAGWEDNGIGAAISAFHSWLENPS